MPKAMITQAFAASDAAAAFALIEAGPQKTLKVQLDFAASRPIGDSGRRADRRSVIRHYACW